MPNDLTAEERNALAWIDECEAQLVAAFQRYKLARRARLTAEIAALDADDPILADKTQVAA
jgi:hypothetical protein